jgi:predicted alpha-1,6-mannanase (GH76 family)
MEMIKKYCFFLIVTSFFFQACGNGDDPIVDDGKENPINWSAAADSSSSNLVLSYWNAADHYFNYTNSGSKDFHYWPQAHALDVMVDAYKRTNDNLYKTTINDWYNGVKAKNGNTFLNVFYDDMIWNSLAMLRAYNVTNDEKFKTSAIEVWNDIKGGWNTTYANGGIAWKKDQPYSKNAVSNGPASIIGSRLFQQFGNASDKEWALKLYDWEKEYLFNPASGAVYDGIDGRTNTTNKAWIFTYNQGTFIGAALELYNITKERGYLNDAVKAADYTLNNLVDGNDRLLKSEGNGDGGLFKGIFIRYFTQLILHPDLDSSVKKRYALFLKHNAETLWRQGTNKSLITFGPYWKTKPGPSTDLTTQTSGAMLIEAAALLKKEGLID